MRVGSLMNIYAKIVGTLKPIEEWVNWCVSKGPPL